MKLAVLALHKIGEPPANGWATWNYVPESVFVDFMQLLRDDDWNVIDLDTALRGLEDPHTLPERAALLTFDDGYESMLTVALPLLERFGYPSVLFVPTGFVGGTNAFDAGNEPEEPICSWDQLRTLQARGVSIQSHGVTHHAFSDLDSAARTTELADSKARLEAELGTEVTAFAYPFGDSGSGFHTTAAAFEGLGYRAAFLYKGGVATPGASERYRIVRVPVGPDTDLLRALGAG